MPLFEYHCRDCGQQFEILTTGSASKPVACTQCGSTQVAKLISAPSRTATRSGSPSLPSGCAAKGGFS